MKFVSWLEVPNLIRGCQGLLLEVIQIMFWNFWCFLGFSWNTLLTSSLTSRGTCSASSWATPSGQPASSSRHRSSPGCRTGIDAWALLPNFGINFEVLSLFYFNAWPHTRKNPLVLSRIIRVGQLNRRLALKFSTELSMQDTGLHIAH